ncbi:MAG: tRNA (guanosine(46)-N7)-methyltransferase TrmB [Actinomycetota bacterium]
MGSLVSFDVITQTEYPRIRTVRRRGRLTTGQRHALDRLSTRYIMAVDHIHDPGLDTIFGRSAPRVLDIGFGTGESTLAMAARETTRDVIAVELHDPGIARFLEALATHDMTHVRVIRADGRDVLDAIPPGSLAEVRVFFPDPWPKTKHHRRRLLDEKTIHLIATRLQPSGVLHVATDWSGYADQIVRAVTAQPLLDNDFPHAEGIASSRPQTHFERRGISYGHTIIDIVAQRVPDSATVEPCDGLPSTCQKQAGLSSPNATLPA